MTPIIKYVFGLVLQSVVALLQKHSRLILSALIYLERYQKLRQQNRMMIS